MNTQVPANFYPDKIIVEKTVMSLAYTRKILSNLPGVPVELVDETKDTKKYFHQNNDKRVFLLTNYKGNVIKKCPGSRGVLCCNYFVANLINGCPYSCTYCILKDYLNCGSIMVCVNIDKFFHELSRYIKPGYVFRLGTGELADSLAFDPLLHLTDELLPRLKQYPSVLLELKTKSAYIDRVLRYDMQDQVIVAWSLNPQEIIDLYEEGSVSLDNRIGAAQTAVKHGYRVAFHFDPVILVDGWSDKYSEVIKKIFQNIPAEKIVWISMGGLRFTASLKRMSLAQHKETDIFSHGEFVMCRDNKLRYFRPLRRELYRKMLAMIRRFSQTVPVYMCMETTQVWQEVFNTVPAREKGLSLVYDKYPDKNIDEGPI